MDWAESKRAVIKLEQLLRCFHCHRVMDEPQTLGACDHHLCRGCINAALSGSSCECPVCGLPAWVKDLKTNRQMDNLVKLVSNLKLLLTETLVSTLSQPATSFSVSVNISKPCTPLASDTKLLDTANKPEDGVFKKPQLIRKSGRTNMLRDALGGQPNPLQPHGTSLRHALALQGVDSNLPVVQSPLVTSQRSLHPNQPSLTTNCNVDGGTVLGKRFSTSSQAEDKIQHKKQHSHVLEETMANIPSVNVEFPFSPLVTRTRNYAKLDKPGKLQRLRQSRLAQLRKKDKKQLTLCDFLVTSADKNATSSVDVSVKGKKTSLPATPTSSHARTMRRNIRGETSLHIASIKGDLAEVCVLLKQGADPNGKDNAGWTPLHEACNHGHVGVVTRLLDHGALINTPGFDGDTPLHDAVANGHVDVVKQLLQRGASVTLRNQQGYTARDLGVSDVMKEVFANHFVKSSIQISPNVFGDKHINQEVDGSSHFILLCTGLKGYQKKQVEDAADVLGASIVTFFSTNVSHIVTSCNQAMCCSRTLKFLCGVATGKWIVSIQWVVDSLDNQSWANEINYEVAGVTVGDSNLISEAPKKGRENAAQKLPGLFEGRSFYLSGAFGPPHASKVELSKIIELAGGTILSRDPMALQTSDMLCREQKISTFFVYEPYSELSCSGDLYKNLHIVPSSWVLDCLSCFEMLAP